MKSKLNKLVLALGAAAALGACASGPAMADGVSIRLGTDSGYHTCYRSNYSPYYCDRNEYNSWYRAHPRWNHWGRFYHDRNEYHANYDRDHDGVPNRYDSNPNNPYRR